MDTNPIPRSKAKSHFISVDEVLLWGDPIIETCKAESYWF